MITLFLKELSEKQKRFSQHNKLIEALKHRKYPISVSGPKGFYLSVVLSRIYRSTSSSMLIITPTRQEAKELFDDIEQIESEAVYFPDWEVIPFSGNGPSPEVTRQRVACLSRLLEKKKHLVICPLRGLITPVPPESFLQKMTEKITVGKEIDPQKLELRLVELGYFKVPKVSVPGEFALRGEVLDIFMPAFPDPVRIVFEFDLVEEIKSFNPFTQASLEKMQTFIINPVREIIWTAERIKEFTASLGSFGIEGDMLEAVEERLLTEGKTANEEVFFPLSFKESGSLRDYFPEEATTVFLAYERLKNVSITLERELREIYKKNINKQGISIPLERIYHDFSAVEEKQGNIIRFPLVTTPEDKDKTVFIQCDGARSFFGNINYLKDELSNLIEAGYDIYIFSESESQKTRIAYLLQELKIQVLEGHISSGFILPDLKIVVIQENEIFGRKRRPPSSLKKVKSAAIETFVDLNPGDFVVHMNYGIGKFLTIERIKAAGTERDYIKLLYAENETIFIPIEQVNLIQRYIGSEGNEPKLDRMGGKSWEKRKQRVRQSVEDLASRLIQLYSKRQNAKGYAFPSDTDWQIQFEASFPYEETEDQLTCIDEVKADMESSKPMDRLVCGDVGYGKTEIAMRAAFKAVLGGKQVAFLGPTTVLVEQHYENFKERFNRYPVNIEMLSRFVPKGEQKKTIVKLIKGDVDLLIGTHRLLQKDVLFKNLGLLIIDEEQRFGVKHKERLKELKHSIDCLTLSATPIPRTLHMSLLKIRDMSVLKTPPSNRLPIETHISAFDEAIIQKAIRKEISRGGQVFFLHNRIETLEATKSFLEKTVPEAMVEVAHGQLASRDLEDIMHRFVHGAFHILVSTTIIENGIDIPNVNTIIIDRADIYGISQLYQLRGRVGRAGRTAFAYLLYPGEKVLSELAMKRLQIISDNTSLGSGFKVALKDLEVRGAGNLIGREQHGDILSVGFDMYLRLLDEAISEMQESPKDLPPEVYLELEYSGYIPDTYIKETEEKMEIYKKIASIITEDELGRIASELDDRFGPLPEEVQSLLSLAEIRIICSKLWISSMRERGGEAHIEFSKVSRIPIDNLLRLISESGGSIRLDAKRPNFIIMKTSRVGLKEKSEFVRDKLSSLIPDTLN